MNGYRLVVTTGEEKFTSDGPGLLKLVVCSPGGWVRGRGAIEGHHTTAEVCKVVVLSFGTGFSPFSRFHTPTLKIKELGELQKQ